MWFRSPAWDSVVYWALDLETGGLDAERDAIVAVGMVPVRGGMIQLRESYRTLVRPEGAAEMDPDAVRAHQLVWGEVAAAPPLADALREVDRRVREGALLVHHKGIDVRFLRRGCRRAGLRWPAPPVVDTRTLLLQDAAFRHPGVAQDQVALNLAVARRRYGLPEYRAHDALTDALATAELFLVLRERLGARTLRELA